MNMKKIFSLMVMLLVSIAIWADNSYFKVIGGSFESGDVTLEITICDAMRVEFEPMEQYASVTLYNNGTNLGYAYVKDGNASTDENKVTVHFTGFTPPADADVKKYYTFLYNKNILLDGEKPIMSYYSYGQEYQPYAEVVSGSLDEGNLTVKVTVPYADEVSEPSYGASSKRVSLCYLDGTYKGMSIAHTYMSEAIAYEGNTVTLPFTLDLGTKRNTLINWSVSFFSGALNTDARASSAGIDVPFTDVCNHSDVRQYPYQEPDGYNGHRACLVCQACYKTFCTWDTEHTNPIPWSVFSLPTYDASCAHEHYTYGKCDVCGRKCPHVNGTQLVTPECQGRYSQVYKCMDCAQYFLEENGRNSITERAVTHIFADPDVQYDDYCHNGCGRISPAKCKHYHTEVHEAVESCEGPGYREYLECTDCGTLFDENGEIRPLEYFEVPAVGHQYNYYGVCSVCGREDVESGFVYDYCPGHELQEIATSRRSCVDYSTGADFVRCYRCERYFSIKEFGEMQLVLKSAIPTSTPGDVFHGGHIVKLEATEAGCYEHGYAQHQQCTECLSRYAYYLSEKSCIWESRLSESYYEKYIKKAAHNGHDFNGTAVCSRCGFAATYREINRTAELMSDAFHIIVGKIGDQYYAMGRPAPRVNETLWEHSGGNGYEAVPVELNEDGTITVSDSKVAQLYLTTAYHYTLPRENFYAFLDPVDGQFISDYPNYPYDAGLTIADGICAWDARETTYMSLEIYDGVSELRGEDDPTRSFCGVNMKEFVDKGALLFTQPHAARHTTGYKHAVYLGKNPGEAPRFHFGGWIHGMDSYSQGDPEYAEHYPAHVYLIDSEAHANVDSNDVVVRGRMSKRDVSDITESVSNNYTYTIRNGVDEEDAKVTNIDFTAVTFTEDVTAADIESMKDAYGFSANVLATVPSASDVKGTNIINDGKCENLVVTDGENMNINEAFEAANASYERPLTAASQNGKRMTNAADSKWGTLVLPFAVESNDDIQLYELEAVSEEDGANIMTFKATSKAEAGQPVVFRLQNADAAIIRVAATNVVMNTAAPEAVSTNVEGWSINGAYKKTVIKSNANGDDKVKRYSLVDDMFCNAEESVVVPSFRAWLETSSEGDDVKADTYIIINGESTSILSVDSDGKLSDCTVIYDLSGRRLNKPQKGINIVNGRKIMVK